MVEGNLNRTTLTQKPFFELLSFTIFQPPATDFTADFMISSEDNTPRLVGYSAYIDRKMNL